jgi:hypothetical protein
MKAGVSAATIRNFESGKRVPHGNNLRAIRLALEQAGMRFPKDGVRKVVRRKPQKTPP